MNNKLFGFVVREIPLFFQSIIGAVFLTLVYYKTDWRYLLFGILCVMWSYGVGYWRGITKNKKWIE
jgi:hypothetical protein